MASRSASRNRCRRGGRQRERARHGVVVGLLEVAPGERRDRAQHRRRLVVLVAHRRGAPPASPCAPARRPAPAPARRSRRAPVRRCRGWCRRTSAPPRRRRRPGRCPPASAASAAPPIRPARPRRSPRRCRRAAGRPGTTCVASRWHALLLGEERLRRRRGRSRGWHGHGTASPVRGSRPRPDPPSVRNASTAATIPRMSTLEGPIASATRTEIGGLVVDEVPAGVGRIKRVLYPPGWRWTTHMSPVTHTDLCMHAHVGLPRAGADGGRVRRRLPRGVRRTGARW